MSRLVLRAALGVAMAAALVTGPALAQQAGQPSSSGSSSGSGVSNLDSAARVAFMSGREAFQRGDYERALDRFTTAHRLSPR